MAALFGIAAGGKTVRMHFALKFAVALVERGHVDCEATRQAEQLEVILIEVQSSVCITKKGQRPLKAPLSGREIQARLGARPQTVHSRYGKDAQRRIAPDIAFARR
jgi:hypothetical protein